MYYHFFPTPQISFSFFSQHS